eukprot:TRINITY_DN16008_c0_g1_i1.p1 TRINITY_DN16008_c0_g1~~TRINITY_DN16008_c0_g1_i1.p1  ORF type:complete len:106 (+),score=25.80 TRINITY_DN16008_c0_g1_i1:51-368(+)
MSKIYHLVLMKFKKDIQPSSVEKLTEGLLSLKKLKGVIELTAGTNFCNRSKGYEYGLTVIFENKESLDYYQNSTEHTQVKNDLIVPIVEDLLVVDYPFPKSNNNL